MKSNQKAGQKKTELKKHKLEKSAFDALKAENTKLQKAVQQNTRLLENKKRQLEIENAVEKVRAVAMRMKKPGDLLSICEVMFRELKKLGFAELRNAMINIHYDVQAYLLNYDYSDTTGKTVTKFRYNIHPIVDNLVYHASQSRNRFTKVVYKGKKLEEWKLFRKQNGEAGDKRLKNIKALYYYFYSTGAGAVGISLFKEASEDQLEVLKRFRNVFDLAYKRYVDINKAEAQAREAQIEAALEKVRSRSLGMNKSDELQQVVNTVFEQLKSLKIEMNVASIFIFEKGSRDWQQWVASSDTKYSTYFHIPYIDNIIFRDLEDARQSENDFYSVRYSLKAKNKWFRYAFANTEYSRIPEKRKKFLLESPFYEVSFALAKNTGIQLAKYSGDDFSEEDNQILKRFSKVFNQAYTRFLDLQKAEAQAREAQIEAALERVRSRTIAMHQTSELQEVIHTVHKELLGLGLSIYGGSFVVINEDVDPELRCWGAGGTADTSEEILVPHFNMPFCTNLIKGIRGKPRFFTEEFLQKDKKKYFTKLFKQKPWSGLSDEQKKQTLSTTGGYTRSVAVSKHTSIFIVNEHGEKFSEADNDILKRFAKVFEQTYTRFLDLQKAEAQAREAQIEAALERVRSASMAMHKSQELQEVIMVVSEQLLALGIKIDSTLFIKVLEDGSWDVWNTTPTQTYPAQIHIPFTRIPPMTLVNKAYKQGKNEILLRCSKKQKDKFLEYFFTKTEARKIPVARKKYVLNSPGWALSFFFMKNIILGITTLSGIPFSEEENEVFRRFKKVFEQAYTRFLDLQKAETQAREAEIQLALERVRARTMAMHHSDELGEGASVLFEQISSLTATPDRFNIGITNEEDKIFDIWVTDQEGHKITKRFVAKAESSPVIAEVFRSWQKKENYTIHDLYGKKLENWVRYMGGEVGMPFRKDSVKEHRFLSYIFFSHGFIGVTTHEEPGLETIHLLERFSKVFQQTYVRFLDLQKAEAQAREAIKQASLDRVRGEIASMRTSEDLNRITPVIWRELKALEVPFIRCGVFIVDEDNESVGVFLTTPDGKALGVLHLAFDENSLTRNAVDYWRKKQVYKEHWNKEEFINWTKSMMKLGQVQNAETYQGSLQPPESLYLHFVPFTQGMLYVGDISPLVDEKLELVKTLAEAFSMAYARYEDFNRLEAAKKQVDHTLNELQATQKQLIQSEKMASLGELTAGIAHEIQNPLNFVNNFSEVSKELLEEMRTALENGDKEEAEEIANDLIQNLEKINQHGKRADGIVKGMLQHSRKSEGKKEPTDINSLCDEYLRLSYHGMRAKDKSFNVDFKTDFDESIDKINIIPQDIGRVLLNLYNNAFYACAEHSRNVVNEQKEGISDLYQPVVSVITKKSENSVMVTVSDNGGGMPQTIVDKIFQPFFTTKPTGSGTGLGLSLSYDIIKAHGGELKVETKENVGSAFVVLLPC